MTSPWTASEQVLLLEQQRREYAADLATALAEKPGGLFSIKRAEAAPTKPPVPPVLVQAPVSTSIN